MNISRASQIIQTLVSKNVSTFCVCPSARNAPLCEVLFQSHTLNIFRFFDERAASFFALGRAKRETLPAAVVVTSGTAVCELLPAVCEAYYASVPLVLLTADRPSAYRGTAAPQCIKQTSLFSSYISKEWDLENGNSLDLSSWDQKSSLHINVQFDEPLIDEPVFKIKINFLEKTNQSEKYFKTDSPSVKKVKTFLQKEEVKPATKKNVFSDSIEGFFKKSSKPVIILSELKKSLALALLEIKSLAKIPIYAEPLSQLREEPKLQNQILKSESVLEKSFQKKFFDGVIRIGAVPVSKFWRNLNNLELPVLSFSLSEFSGLKNKAPALSLEEFLDKKGLFEQIVEKNKLSLDGALLEWDHLQFLDLEKRIQSKQNKEWSWIRWLSEQIPENSHVFLGNSLPIREWSLCASRKNKGFIYSANRGANGIDGLVSSFLGVSSEKRLNYCVLGDLSMLYDLSAPWILKQIPKCKICIIVINNFGGGIFKNKFKNPLFLNSHKIDFSDFSKMWGLEYQKINHFMDTLQNKSPALVEIPIP